MHQIAFELKRAHLRTVAYGEHVLLAVPGMTAARFDLLCLLRQKALLTSSDPRHALTTGIAQRELWQRLDLCKTTISKMLTRLEELGWIRRRRSTSRGDWRTKMVFLTPTGLRHIAKAMRIMFRQRMLLKYFERIYKSERPYRFEHVVKTLLDIWQHIQFIANAFGDRSMVAYEFGPVAYEGPWDFEDFRKRRPFDPIYVPPPTPKLPPMPRSGADRLPCRPIEHTEYENSLRRVVWNQEKRPRRRRLDDSVL